MNGLTVIIPVYNEEVSILSTVEKIKDIFNNTPTQCEIICVNAEFTDPIFNYTNSTYDVEGMSPYNREYLPLYEAITDSLVRGMDVKSKVAFIDGVRKAVQNNEIPATYSFCKNIWEEFKEYWRFASFKSTFHANGYRYAGGAWSRSHNFIGIFSFGILLPFFILGIFFSFVNKNYYSIFLISIIIFHMLVHIFLYHVRERYRIHVDPFIIILAFYGWFSFWNKTKEYYNLSTNNNK